MSPSLDWDGGNSARELGEWLLRVIEHAAARPAPHTLPAPAEFTAADGQVFVSVGSLQEAVDQLRRLSRPFLARTGQAERLLFDVPTLPLFVHERLFTQAIVETLVGHKTATSIASAEHPKPVARSLKLEGQRGLSAFRYEHEQCRDRDHGGKLPPELRPLGE